MARWHDPRSSRYRDLVGARTLAHLRAAKTYQEMCVSPDQLDQHQQARSAIVKRIMSEFPDVPTSDDVRELLMIVADFEVFDGVLPRTHDEIRVSSGNCYKQHAILSQLSLNHRFYMHLVAEMMAERRQLVAQHLETARVKVLEEAAGAAHEAIAQVVTVMREGGRASDRLAAAKEIIAIGREEQKRQEDDSRDRGRLASLGAKVDRVLTAIGEHAAREVPAEDAEVVEEEGTGDNDTGGRPEGSPGA